MGCSRSRILLEVPCSRSSRRTAPRHTLYSDVSAQIIQTAQSNGHRASGRRPVPIQGERAEPGGIQISALVMATALPHPSAAAIWVDRACGRSPTENRAHAIIFHPSTPMPQLVLQWSERQGAQIHGQLSVEGVRIGATTASAAPQVSFSKGCYNL